MSGLSLAIDLILPAAVLWVYRFDFGRQNRQQASLPRPDPFQSVGDRSASGL
ncbi:MAG: hypothetical protein HC810_05005 [Acaryochloridaceae cyanobacterium RL_2_7]|nr:hypothetical protein [Acaryochloridaceae cyanobacterium RL_2_7]